MHRKRSFVMVGVPIFVGAGAIVAIITTLGVLLLPACGVHGSIASTWIGWCPVNVELQSEERMAAIWNSNHQLRLLILERERALAAMQCHPENPSAVEFPSPAPIDRNDWNARDISLLEGCWNLDSHFSTRNRQTGVESVYDTWRMCFNSRGAGTEEMRSGTGSTCTGNIQATFDADGSLEIQEPVDLQCSDGSYIFRLVSRCTLNDDGTANCVVSQPETGSATTVKFRRAARGN